jgi:hypothetical protein
MQIRPLLLYIASDVRSGSTLLDLLLGGHPQIVSVGEIQYLNSHFRREGIGYSWQWLCTCGERFDVCPFWSIVNKITENKLKTPLTDLDTKVNRTNATFPLTMLSDRSLGYLARYYSPIGQNLNAAKNCWEIIDIIHTITDKPVIVDSSKTAEQLRFLYRFRPASIRMIYLIRDGRGVVYSKMNRVRDSVSKASKSWVLENVKIFLIMTKLPKTQRLILRYEDLCRSPEITIGKVIDFINVPSQQIEFSKTERHNVGGSPHRFNYSDTTIRLDERWRNGLSPRDLKVFACVGGWLNRLMGYR